LSNLLYLDMLLTSVLFLGCLVILYLAYMNYKERKLNRIVSHQLDTIIKEAQIAFEKQKQKLSPSIVHNTSGADLNDPQVLATLVTVLIHKMGNVRLNVHDFTNVGEEEYVSVYVDSNTHDLVLSLDHSLGTEGSESLVSTHYKTPDDETYH